MLVLTRKKDESLYMWFEDEKADVRILGIRGNQVKIGITADRKVKVLRDNVKPRAN